MATQYRLFFDPVQEATDGKGWTTQVFDDADVESQISPVITTYATITAAMNAGQDMFSHATDVVTYFNQKAAATYLTTNSATVATAAGALLTAEGLDYP